MTSMMIEKNKKISEILNKKHILFSELLDITRQQVKCIEEEEWDRLLNTIESKQLRIDSINHLDNDIKQLIAETEISESNHDIEEVEEKIRVIISEMLEIEHKNASIIKEKMNHTKEDIQETRLKIKVSSVYGRTQEAQNEGYFIDKKK